MTDYTRKLAEFSAGISYEGFPCQVVERAKLFLADSIACAAAGARYSELVCRWGAELAESLNGAGDSHVWFNGHKTSPMLAALANAVQIHSIDFDDSHQGSVSHMSAVLVGHVLSYGEVLHSTGKDVLTAYILGFEVGTRVGNCMNKDTHDHYQRWHPTATFGTVAGSAAAAKLRGFDANQTELCLGYGIDQAAGFRYSVDKGDFSKILHPGLAAMRGVISAETVAVGADGPRGLLEYPTGFFHSMCTCPNPEDFCLTGLGTHYELMDNMVKLYPCCMACIPGVEATIQCMRTNGLLLENVENIHIRIALAVGQNQDYRPVTPLGGRLSIPYCIALAAEHGGISLEDFTEDRLHDEAHLAVVDKVHIEPAEDLYEIYHSHISTECIITDKTGREYKCLQPYVIGSPKNPASPESIRQKYFDLTGLVWPEEKQQAVYQAIEHLEEFEDIGDFVTLLLKA